MSDLDLILKGGTVFLSNGRANTDIGVKNGKIVNIGPCSSAETIVDCSNLFIFPFLLSRSILLFTMQCPAAQRPEILLSTIARSAITSQQSQE